MTNAMPNFRFPFGQRGRGWPLLAAAASGLMAVFPAPQAHAQGVETTDVDLNRYAHGGGWDFPRILLCG